MKALLMILDGWGINHNRTESAVEVANTPNMKEYLAKYPNTQLQACGLAVGLPEGQMGNSEVGHLNMGAGRIVYQELTRITKSIKDGDFFTNEELVKAVTRCQNNTAALHLYGLFSDGGVHSHLDHVYGLLQLAKKHNVAKVYVHAFLDGRDVPPRCADTFFTQFEAAAKKIGVGQIATVVGRYYAMDRDNRWERVSQAYEMLTGLKGFQAKDAHDAIAQAYARNEDDEFVKPTIVAGAAPIKDGDSVIFFNFRPDRAREITRAFVDKDFKGFVRNLQPKVQYVCMTQYDETIPAAVAFAKADVNDTLAEVLSNKGLTQLHTAETEKYAHVTFFFNGGKEEPVKGEDRVLIQSPKVATYDLQPEMSAPALTESVLNAIAEDKHDVIIMNYANPDMVGHTGVFAAAVKAVEAVDAGMGKVVAAARAKGAEVLITADHGNSDQMLDHGQVWTAHSLNPVPFIYVTDKKVQLRKDGVLADVAATVLDVLNIQKPKAFTQDSLIVK